MDTEEEQDNLYRIQLLQAFGLDEWDDDVINSAIYELYESMKIDENLQNILLNVSKIEALQNLFEMSFGYIDHDQEVDKNIIFITVLFQYDYFYLFHRCIYDFITTKTITDKSMNTLLDLWAF
jgi:hypothetical protein